MESVSEISAWPNCKRIETNRIGRKRRKPRLSKCGVSAFPKGSVQSVRDFGPLGLGNLLVATAQTITKSGTPLSSNGDGTLKIAVTPAVVGVTSEEILAYSDEIVTTTGVQLVRIVVA